MTTTPTIWKPKFIANAGTLGNQLGPQSIGLLNGNILVVWEDDTFGSGAGIDIVGQLFDPNGNPLGGQFQVNSAFVTSNETEPKIVALPNGDFVVAYGSFSTALGGFIAVERFDSSGVPQAFNTIVDDRNSLTKWELTVDFGGSYTIAYERDGELLQGNGDVFVSTDVRAVTYAFSNNLPAQEVQAGQNTRDEDLLGNVATPQSPNETIRNITVTRETDDGVVSVEYKVVNQLGGVLVGSTNLATGIDVADVAALAGGPFVVVYSRLRSAIVDADDVVAFRIVSGTSGDPTEGPEIGVSLTFNTVKEVRVLALDGGGFYVVWSDKTANAILGTRYTTGGAVVGQRAFQIATDISSGDSDVLGNLSLTIDGRILVPFRSINGEIALVILDPRDNTIVGKELAQQYGEFPEVITTQIGDTTLSGRSGDDILLGQAGTDTLNGDAGNDVLKGGLGRDTLNGGLGDDVFVLQDVTVVSVIPRRIFFDTVAENANEGLDTVEVERATAGSFTVSSYALPANVENGVVRGTGAFDLFGNELDNTLAGNGAVNTLGGLLGSDTIYGFAGNDAISDGGADTQTVRDFLFGGTGNDTYDVWNTLVSAQDIVFENNVDNGPQGGSPSDIDTINSHGEFFRDFYSTGEILVIAEDANAQFATTYLVGGENSNAQIFGNSGSNAISTYGGSKTVDAGGGTDAISFSLFDLSFSFEGSNTLVSRAGTGIDYLYGFQSGVDKVDLRSFAFGISGQQVLAQGVNVFGSDPNSFSDDYCYFYLTNAGGVDNYVAFVGLTTAQLQANDFITA